MKIKESVCAYVKVTPYTCDFVLRNQGRAWCAQLESRLGWRKYLNRKVALTKFDPVTGEIYQNPDNLRRALGRARKSVVDYALCNDFEYFGTITIDPKKYDVDRPDLVQKAISAALHSYQQTHPNLKYIYTAEYGKKTKRLHFHFLASGLETFINEKGKPDCHLFRDNFGWCQISKIGDTPEDKLYSSLYCSKYISKQSIRVAHRYFFNSHGLKKPDKLFLTGTLALMAYEELRKMNANDFCHTRYQRCFGCSNAVWCGIWERISIYREVFKVRRMKWSPYKKHVWLYKPQKMTDREIAIFEDVPIQYSFLD